MRLLNAVLLALAMAVVTAMEGDTQSARKCCLCEIEVAGAKLPCTYETDQRSILEYVSGSSQHLRCENACKQFSVPPHATTGRYVKYSKGPCREGTDGTSCRDTGPFKEATDRLVAVRQDLEAKGLHPLEPAVDVQGQYLPFSAGSTEVDSIQIEKLDVKLAAPPDMSMHTKELEGITARACLEARGYEVHGKLGNGAFGVVRKVVRNGIQFAVKEILVNVAQRPLLAKGRQSTSLASVKQEIFKQNTAAYAGITVPITDAWMCSTDLHKQHRNYFKGSLVFAFLAMPKLGKSLGGLVASQRDNEFSSDLKAYRVRHHVNSPGLGHLAGQITQPQLDQLRNVITIAYRMGMLPFDAHYGNFMTLGDRLLMIDFGLDIPFDKAVEGEITNDDDLWEKFSGYCLGPLKPVHAPPKSMLRGEYTALPDD